MATAKLTLDTRSIKKDGTHSVKLYVTHKGGDFFISTNISVKTEDWIGRDKEPTKSKKLNSALIQILVQAQAHIYKLRADNKLVTMDIKMLRKALMTQSLDQEQSVPHPTTLVATYFEKFITAKDCAGTKSVYTQTLTKIGKYFNLNTLFLNDINLVWLREFESNMKSDGLPKQEYINRGYFELKEKLIDRNSHESFTVIKVLVTQKGLDFLARIFEATQTPKKMAVVK